MTALVIAPTQSESRGAYADWIELQVLIEARPETIGSLLSNIIDIEFERTEVEEFIDPELLEPVDLEILDRDRESFEATVIDELEYRLSVLGEAYPFRFRSSGIGLELAWSDPEANWGKTVYVFCLLASAIREGRLKTTRNQDRVERAIANGFQACACIAAGGCLGGSVVSFGYPRPDASGFLEALANAYARFGAGSVIGTIPHGVPKHAKDEGIDIIAWRDHPDRMPGKVYMLGQCASGKNWPDKSVVTYLESYHVTWFSRRPAVYLIPAMFIPFALHGTLDDDPNENYSEVVRTQFWRHEQKFGILFDRLRIAHYAFLCQGLPPNTVSDIDGISEFPEVVKWVNEVLGSSASEVAA